MRSSPSFKACRLGRMTGGPRGRCRLPMAMAARSLERVQESSLKPQLKRADVARRLVVMMKEPRAGRVKTRLARGAGVVRATWFYRQAGAALVRRLAADRRWQTSLAVAPDPAIATRMLPKGVKRRAQGGGDLGQRLQRVFARTSRGPVVIIGSDCPDVTTADIACAFRALGRADMVLGPAGDGGYWLIGARRTPKVIDAFPGVRWSSATTLADTLVNLGGHEVELLRHLDDVDEAGDLPRVANSFARRVPPTRQR